MAEILRKALPALGTVLLAAGCAASSAVEEDAPAPARAVAQAPEQDAAPTVSSCVPGRAEKLGDRRLAYAARAVGHTSAFTAPDGRRLHVFDAVNVNGVDTVFGVRAVLRDERCAPSWYRVQLPIRPNGVTGWVRAGDVRLETVHTRIAVDLSDRRIDFYREGRRVLRATAGVGSDSTPTPTGRFYVNQRLRAGDPSGPFPP